MNVAGRVRCARKGGGAPASITFAQEAEANGVAPTSLTLAAVQTGDCVALQIGTYAGNVGAVTGVSGLGATWTRAVYVIDPSIIDPVLETWVGYGCTAGGTTISLTWGSSPHAALAASVYHGVKSSATPVVATGSDWKAWNSGSPNTDITSGAASSTAAGQLAVVGFALREDNPFPTFSSYTDTPAAFTTLTDAFESGFVRTGHGYLIETGAASTSRTAHLSATQDRRGTIVILDHA